MPSVVILGASGAFGALFTRAFLAEGWSVAGIDREGAGAEGAAFVRGDATALEGEAAALVAQADVVLVSLPETAALRAADGLLGAMRDDALWVDLVAVKGPLTEVLTRAASARAVEVLGFHPIFAPQSGFAGQTALAVDVRAGTRAHAFVALLGTWGVRTTWLDARTHDRHLASVQAATHAALLAFGAALGELDYDVERGIALGTRPHRLLVSLLARVVGFDADAYWEVQESNPHALEARAALRRGLDALDAVVASGDAAAFRARFVAVGALLEPKRESLAADCARQLTLLGPTQPAASLEDYRRELDALDGVLLELLGRRLDICRDVAKFKRAHDIPMMQPGRVEAVKARAAERGRAHGLDPAFATRLYEAIIDEACRLEDDIIDAPPSASGPHA